MISLSRERERKRERERESEAARETANGARLRGVVARESLGRTTGWLDVPSKLRDTNVPS